MKKLNCPGMLLMLAGCLEILSACNGGSNSDGKCKGVDCTQNGTCMEFGGQAVCACMQGYRAEGLTCVDGSGPCDDVDCSGHGACVVVDDQARCACLEGYREEDLSCVPIDDPCQDISCSGYGACVMVGDDPVCACLNGYLSVGTDCIEEISMVPMRDGVHLRTRIFLPDPVPAEGAATVVWRTPYRSPGILEYTDELSPVFTSRGYAYVVQDCRGRGDSEGDFYPHLNEFTDGRDTTDWIVSQIWSNGRVGMIGCSYPGYCALAAAVDNPNVYVVVADDSAEDNTWHTLGGLFKSGSAIAWFQTLDYLAGLDISIVDPNDRLNIAGLDQLVLGRMLPAWQDLVAHENPLDPFWDDMTLRGRYQDICSPVLNLWSHKSWDDPKLIWAGLTSESCEEIRSEHRLMVTPDGHCHLLGELLDSLPSQIDQFTLDFIDKWLGEKDVDLSQYSRVQYRAVRDWEYRGSMTWPPNGWEETFYLRTAPEGEPSLIADPEAGNPEQLLDIDPVHMKQCEDEYPAIYYYSDILSESLYLAGHPEVTLFVSATTSDADFNLGLYEYQTDSMQYTAVAQGQVRARYRNGYENPELLVPGEVVELTIPLYGNGAHLFPKNGQIVLMITGSACGQAENPHTGESLNAQTEWLESTYSIFHDTDRPSKIVLPVIQTNY